jgi:hypothetical protein
METYRGVEMLLANLEHYTGWKLVASFTPLPLYPQEKTPHTHWIEGWVGPTAGNRTRALQLVARRYYRLSYPGSRMLCVKVKVSKVIPVTGREGL